MSQTLSDKRPLQKAAVVKRRAARLTSHEHRREMEARLRMVEADARWKRGKEMIFVGSVATVVLSVCVPSAKVFWSSSSTLSDKQLAAALLGQILALLIGVLVGKNFKLKD